MEIRHIPGYANELDKVTIELYRETVDSTEQRVRGLLPGLPTQIYYAWFNEESNMIVPRYQTGGSAWDPQTVLLAVSRDGNMQQTQEELVDTVFHELYHLMQGFTEKDEDGNQLTVPMVDNAILEGAASVFEREYARKDGTLPYYADYTEHTEDELTAWLQQLRDLPDDLPYEAIAEWKFYHQKLGVNHIMYKVGAWIVDQALALNNSDTIVDYVTIKPSAIIAKAGLAD